MDAVMAMERTIGSIALQAALGFTGSALQRKESAMAIATTNLYPFIRRVLGLPEGFRMHSPHFLPYGFGFGYGYDNGDGEGRMEFAYYQQTLEYGDGEVHGDSHGDGYCQTNR